jgi:5-hydroxyisourate hydrolase-like protein (transthyretin family)
MSKVKTRVVSAAFGDPGDEVSVSISRDGDGSLMQVETSLIKWNTRIVEAVIPRGSYELHVAEELSTDNVVWHTFDIVDEDSYERAKEQVRLLQLTT